MLTDGNDIAKQAGEASYDPLAWFYNRYWGGESLEFLPALDALLLDRLGPGARVLDLACGTGQLARHLTGRGLRVTGVDSAGALLRYARDNAPAAHFVHADIRTFQVDGRFDAAVSAYDSLNHLLSVPDLVAAFRRAGEHLEPGGLLLFDVNDEQGYRDRWNNSFGLGGDDHAGIFRFSYDAEERLGRFDATLFFPEPGADGWRRTDLTLPQRCHPVPDLTTALTTAGFEPVEVRAAGEFGIARNAGRVFVLAGKGMS